jgi:hypothetical protein
MKFAKVLLAMTCAGVLSLTIVGSARHVYAQDAAETDENIGSWNGPDGNSAEQSIGDAKKHTLSIKGCWAGSVMDTGDTTGTSTFQFVQSSNHKKLLLGSTFKFLWPDAAMARGPFKGSVTSTGFNFKGNAGAGCAVSANGTGDSTAITGTVVFVGACATIFQDVTFSITPGCM